MHQILQPIQVRIWLVTSQNKLCAALMLSMISKTKKKKEKYKKRELDIKGCSLAKYVKKMKSCFTFTKIQRFNLQFQSGRFKNPMYLYNVAMFPQGKVKSTPSFEMGWEFTKICFWAKMREEKSTNFLPSLPAPKLNT